MPLLPALLVVNPAAGPMWRRARAKLDLLRDVLSSRGFDATPCLTAGPGHATELAREAAANGLAAVFVLGGDGTQREAAAGLAGSETALGLLPAGTANVLAPSLGLTRSALDAAHRFGLDGDRPVTRLLDVGQVTDCGGRVEPFLMMCSRGLDARTLARLRELPELKRRLGQSGVVVAALGEWLRALDPPFEYHTPDMMPGTSERATFLSVQNLASYGFLPIAPGADPFDGVFDLIAFAGAGRYTTLGFALALLRGAHLRFPGVVRRPVTELELSGDGAALCQIDGDALEVALPARISLAAWKLRVLVPVAAAIPAEQGIPARAS